MHPIASAEILSVGTELLLGEIVDSNSAYLAGELARRSVDVYWSLRVGDNRARIADALRTSLRRSDLVLVSGGLGPTDDDVTREAVADVAGETPTVDAGLERALRARFEAFGRDMPEKNLKQAWTIPAAKSLPNPLGTAPGWLVTLDVGGRPRTIVTLPGPPRELKRMFEREVLPRLELPTAAFHSTTFKSLGIGESAVADRLEPWTSSSNPTVATYAKADGVHVRVAARGASRQEAAATAAEAERAVERALGDHLWGRDDDDLPALVARGLARAGASLAVVEHGSAGRLGSLLCDAPLADEAFRGSVIAWTAIAYSSVVAREVANEVRVPSSETEVANAAVAVRERLAATHGLAVGASVERPGDDGTETVLAVADPHGVVAEVLHLPHLGRDWLRERLCYSALFKLWSRLGQPTSSAR